MSLQHMLLGLLDWKSMHGYALREWAQNYSWIYPMTNANIYPTLRRLEESGFVVHSEEVHNGRVRKVYQITALGQDELHGWLGDPSTSRPSVTDPVLLKFSLLRGHAIAAARPWLEKELSDSHAHENHTEACLGQPGTTLSKYDRMVLNHGLELARLRTSWLQEALEEVIRDTLPGNELL